MPSNQYDPRQENGLVFNQFNETFTNLLLPLNCQIYAFSVSFDVNNLVCLVFQPKQRPDSTPLVLRIGLRVRIQSQANFQQL